MEQTFVQQRITMVKDQLITRGITDQETLKAMSLVPRHLFVPEKVQERAYWDMPLSIGEGQTISQPYIVALMTQSARIHGDSKVLDVGTGSGYAAAVFSQIVKEVVTIERVESLAHAAQERFRLLAYDNIRVIIGDGSLGCLQEAPFDAIVVTAGAPSFPQSLHEQLSDEGSMIIPVGDGSSQILYRVKRDLEGKFSREVIEHVRFVPLIGEKGWKKDGL